jgi:hypothetical protein
VISISSVVLRDRRLMPEEHRYYGKSVPVPTLSTDDLRFLNNEESMADSAYVSRLVDLQSLIPSSSKALCHQHPCFRLLRPTLYDQRRPPGSTMADRTLAPELLTCVWNSHTWSGVLSPVAVSLFGPVKADGASCHSCTSQLPAIL